MKKCPICGYVFSVFTYGAHLESHRPRPKPPLWKVLLYKHFGTASRGVDALRRKAGV